MEVYDRAVDCAVRAAGAALEDLMAERQEGGRIDTRALKDITAALKDLNGIAGEGSGAAGLRVRFEGFAEEAAQ